MAYNSSEISKQIPFSMFFNEVNIEYKLHICIEIRLLNKMQKKIQIEN